MSPSKVLAIAAANALVLMSGSIAGSVIAPSVEVKERSIYDKIWAIPAVYSNKENPVIQEFRFTGRLQGDAFSQDSNFGSEADWIIRRARLGVQMKLFRDFTLAVEGDFSPQDPDPLYTRLTDAFVAWQPAEAFRLAVGKQGARFTMDGATSSTKLLTPERNNLSNNLWFPSEYAPGVTVSGKAGNWEWNTGVFSRGTPDAELGEFNAGNFWLGSLGYDFGKALGVDAAVLRADYVHNEPDATANDTRPFENIGSLTFEFESGKWGFGANVAAGEGFGSQSNVWGFVVMPSYMITDNLQVVARYTYLSSDDPGGVRFNRYESVATTGRGDEYNEYYLGLNYYFYGHKLKLQTGIDYADMKALEGSSGNYHGWTWVTAFRMYF